MTPDDIPTRAVKDAVRPTAARRQRLQLCRSLTRRDMDDIPMLPFTFMEPDFVAVHAIPQALPSEIAAFQAKCAANKAVCISNRDGAAVVELRYYGTVLELFVLMARAFRHGMVERQESVLHLMGRDLGAKTLAFESRRRGWARRLGPNWRPRGTNEFVCYVDPSKAQRARSDYAQL